ncbi:succinate dehydrogenase, cytochrome b556 subunit [Nitzschia inconspicua]|uniref:Succinate dehydrogenase, cytochrome b556 subunit n=1 Tax=Nitzschia inconspicua TaxID=303405 RepID=A0A9K3M8K2_9STRA|nr:succinate dehydrogenase, cytochrome b556 subunit [Nitzschia inconspicua]
MTVLSKESAEEYKKENYTARMKKTGRPVSPHVTIYAFPVGAISSITNRVTGCALSFGAFGLAGLDLLGGAGTSLELMQTIGSQGFLITAPAKFAVTFTVVYHYFGAIRHFAWDYFPDLLNNVDVPKSSWALLGGSTVISAGFMLL